MIEEVIGNYRNQLKAELTQIIEELKSIEDEYSSTINMIETEYKQKIAEIERKTHLFNKKKKEREKAVTTIGKEVKLQKIYSQKEETLSPIIKKQKQLEEYIEKMANKDFAINEVLVVRQDLLKNEAFMLELVAYNERYIMYDRTNSDVVYIEALKKIFENPKYGATMDESFQLILSELSNPKKHSDSKYKIPHKFLFEALKCNLASFYRNQGKKSLSTGFLFEYLVTDGQLDKEDGEKLANIYENEENMLLYCRTSSSNIDDIFKDGLFVTYGKELWYNFWFRGANGCSLMNIIKYASNFSVPIISIPKTATEIVGSNGEIFAQNALRGDFRGLKSFLLPQYIVGALRKKTDGSGLEFVKNYVPIAERTKYPNNTNDVKTNVIPDEAFTLHSSR